MDAHENARTTPHGRMPVVARLATGQSVAAVAASLGVTPRTVRKWRDRHAAEGVAGLRDRSSRRHRSPARLDPAIAARIEALRPQRRTGQAIARELGQPGSAIGLTLRRLGLNHLSALDPKPAVIREDRCHASLAAGLQHHQATLRPQGKSPCHENDRGQPPRQ